MTSPVLFEKTGGSARITLNRPPLNILDQAAIQEMARLVGSLASDKKVRLLEITGSGEKAFSAGVDIRDHLPGRITDTLRQFHRLISGIRSFPFPTLALVRGLCLGGGCELAISCDLALAEEGARFGQPEIDLGCFPPVACSLLPDLVGRRKAFEIVAFGRQFDAEEAMRIGLVNQVVLHGDLETIAAEWRKEILDKSGEVLSFAKEALGHSIAESERIYFGKLMKTEDAVEGIQAFLEKRKPVWRNVE